jgi:hypothetical protein
MRKKVFNEHFKLISRKRHLKVIGTVPYRSQSLHYYKHTTQYRYLYSIVPDPWLFGMDQDPRIPTS